MTTADKVNRTWFLTHPNTKTAHRFRDFHEAILFKLFFTKKPDRFEAHQHGLFEPIDSKAFLEDYFGISLDFGDNIQTTETMRPLDELLRQRNAHL